MKAPDLTVAKRAVSRLVSRVLSARRRAKSRPSNAAIVLRWVWRLLIQNSQACSMRRRSMGPRAADNIMLKPLVILDVRRIQDLPTKAAEHRDQLGKRPLVKLAIKSGHKQFPLGHEVRNFNGHSAKIADAHPDLVKAGVTLHVGSYREPQEGTAAGRRDGQSLRSGSA